MYLLSILCLRSPVNGANIGRPLSFATDMTLDGPVHRALGVLFLHKETGLRLNTFAVPFQADLLALDIL